jgi:hypothetical protein
MERNGTVWDGTARVGLITSASVNGMERSMKEDLRWRQPLIVGVQWGYGLEPFNELD